MYKPTPYQIEIFDNADPVSPVATYHGFSGDRAYAEREAQKILREHDALETHTAHVVVMRTGKKSYE